MGEETTAVAALTTTVVGAAAAPAQAVNASPPAISTPISPDPLQKHVKTLMEAVRSSNRSAVTPSTSRHSIGDHSAANACTANDGAAYAGTADGGSACTGAFYDGSTYATTLVCTSPFLPTQG